ncbi:MAG: type II secretion system F family protein [Acidimicrobiia bacterium]|nr:type II secretion system F family protein [Acidimicrobiia bacterium]
MDLEVILAAVAVSVGVIGALWAIGGVRPQRKGARPTYDLRATDLQRGASTRAIGPVMRWLSIRARRFTPIGLVESLERQIYLSGFADRLPLERALALKALITATAAAIGLFLILVSDALVTGIAVIVGGYFVMDLVLWGRARERQRLIERALPDTMDQLKISVEAGLGFEAALERSGRHGGPLADELGRVVSEIQLGLSRRDAMNNMTARTDVSELRRFVAAMVHAEGFGVPIAQVLRTQADDLRDKRRTRAEEKAQRIPVQIVIPLILFIFPAIFVVLLGPAAINIYDTLLGGL